MDPATEELLFMGMECETSGIEAYNTVRDMENLDTEAAVERTRAILAWLASRNMIDLFLGNRSRMSLTPATVTRLAPTSSEQTGSGPWTVPMTGGSSPTSPPGAGSCSRTGGSRAGRRGGARRTDRWPGLGLAPTR